MATKYDDIIKLRGGKAAYDIAEEKKGEWVSFIPNEQFNNVLRTVIKSVRGNDIDNHKSFWINGTYGTGKSHAVAVVSHLLGDAVEDIRQWVDYEYKDAKFATLRQAIYSLRETKRLLTVNVYGLGAMTHPGDLALVLQKAVTETLRKHKIDIAVPTDYENYIEQIHQNPEIWNHLIDTHTALCTSCPQNADHTPQCRPPNLPYWPGPAPRSYRKPAHCNRSAPIFFLRFGQFPALEMRLQYCCSPFSPD